tara:strand:- start:2730 stop:3062 length:333 start_codon:yes stop_codon:yes gene_type:complete
MKTENNFLRFFGAIALVFVLMLPASVQFSHLFEGHEHEICTEQTTHLHEDAPECYGCDFYSTGFQYTLPENYVNTFVLIPQNIKTTILVDTLFSKKLTSKQLRAPPTVLS